MAKNRIQIKRTSVSGRTANVTNVTNSQYIAAGELALNMPDGILYSSNGSDLITIGANLINQRIADTLTIDNSGRLNFTTVNTSVYSYFTQQNDDNFVFYSTNTAYGARPIWGVYANSVTSNLQVYIPLQLNSGVVANGSIGSPGQILSSNGSATYWATVSGTGTVTQVNTGNGLAGGPITGAGTISVNANDGIVANSSGLYVKAGDNIVVNSSGVHAAAGVNTDAQYTFANTISFTQTINGTANNSLYLNSKTEGNLNVNSALVSNNTNFVGTVSATNVVSNAQLSGNLANYQTTAGLAANVAVLAANSATYLGGNTASDLRIYSDQKADNAYSNAVSYVDGKSYVNTSQLSTNLANYALLSGASFSGNVTANNANTLYNLNVGGNLTVEGNLTVTGNVTTIGANNLSIVDNFIYLNSNNTTQNEDIGIAGNYNDGTYAHTGIFRDATDGYWKVFDGYTPEPDSSVNIDTSNNTFNIAGFWANNIRLGNTTVYSTANSTVFSGTANNTSFVGTVSAANVVSNAQLSSNLSNYAALAGASFTGNVGIGNTTPADKLSVNGTTYLGANVTLNAALIANGGFGTAGHVLHSNGTATYWAADDAGVTSVAAGTGLSGGTITTTGTLSVNATYIGTLSANNTTYVNGKTEGNLNVNAAAQLTTSRNINGVGFNGTGDILVPSIYDSNYRRITNPGGAEYVSQVSSVTGALQITLPVGYTNTMMRMTIRVYNYASNQSFDVVCGGYNYAPSPSWVNTFAYILGDPNTDRRFTVRFGFTAGGKCCVYIGELASSWSYPQFYVTDVQLGYSGYSASWVSGWAMSTQASAFENVTSTISAVQVGYATSTNVAGAVALRDGSGNFSAGTITANLTGTASNATLLNNKSEGNLNVNSATTATNSTQLGSVAAASYARKDIAETFAANVTASSYFTGNWFRSTGASGWYNQTYGGGVWMDNSTQVKVYGSKQLWSGPFAGTTAVSTDTSQIQVQNGGGSGDNDVACISFHCSGTYGSKMHLRSDGYFGIGGWSAATWRWYVNLGNGDMTAAGNVTAYSDIRLKENITPLTNSLYKIKKLNGVRFTWKNLPDVVGSPGKPDFGILAHEVEAVAPELISESSHKSPDGDPYKTVAYDKLVPLLIEAVKELSNQVDELKKKLGE